MTQATYNLAEKCIMKPFTKDLKDEPIHTRLMFFDLKKI